MDKLKLTGRALGRVFNFRSGCMQTKHLLPTVAIQPNLELKTRPKHLLGSHPLVIALPAVTNKQIYSQGNVRHVRTTNHFHTVITATL